MNETLDRARDQQHRARLYVQVMLAVDLLAHFSDAITPRLLDDAPQNLEGVALAVRWAVTIGTVTVWAVLKRSTLSYAAAVVLEVGVTLALALSYVTVAINSYADHVDLRPVFGLLGIVLILVVRASLVPSTVARTAGIGVASLSVLYVGCAYFLPPLDPQAVDGATFMGMAIVMATSVASRVIYGLRQEVRDMKRLGQYVLEGKLGEGGMGVVYRARHGMLRRPTAVKLLPPDRAAAADVTRFEREVRLTAKLTHPNTVTVFDYGRTPDGVFYYAMELLDGATLEDVVVATGPQPASRVLRVLLDCAEALHEAHSIGLIHRDIKPSNIMLCRQGGRVDVVKLLDFGLVKQVDSGPPSPALTGAGAIVGTPLYMAPETVRNPDGVDARSDLYALGAVAYYLLTGTHLFEGSSVIEICASHLHDEPEPPSLRLGQNVVPSLESLILQCLAKSPEGRPESARAFSQELAAISAPEPFRAEEWWADHGPRIASMHVEESAHGRTIAVQPRT